MLAGSGTDEATTLTSSRFMKNASSRNPKLSTVDVLAAVNP